MNKQKLKSMMIGVSITALSAPVMANDFVIATGGEGGSYERLGKSIAIQIQRQADKKKVDFDFEVINTSGSGENIECLSSAECHAAIVQADALNVSKPSVPYKAKTAHTETVYWFYNAKHDKSDIEDIEGDKDYRMVMVDGSGAVFTMQSFVSEDSGYKENYDRAIYADDLYDAFDIVSEGAYNGAKVAGLLYVGNSIPAEIGQDFSGAVMAGEATDGDFDDATDVNGDKLYSKCEVQKSKLAGITTGSWTDQDTVCVKAMVAYSTDVEDRKAMKAIKKGVTKAVRGLK